MQTSDSREQLLFLVTGGIILVLILGVVIFNMVQQSGKASQARESAIPRPVVKHAKPSDPDPQKTSWIDAMAPAPVFGLSSDSPAKVTMAEKEKVDASQDGATEPQPKEEAPPHTKVVVSKRSVAPWGSWSANAGAVESERQALMNEDKQKPARGEEPDSNDGLEDEGLALLEESQEPLNAEIISDEIERLVALPATQQIMVKKSRVVSPLLQSARMLQLSPVPRRFPSSKFTSVPVLRANKPPVKTSANSRRNSRGTAVAANVVEPGYWVRLASFAQERNAWRLVNNLSVIPFEGDQLPVSKGDIKVENKTYFRVQMGPFSNYEQADRASRLVRRRVNITGVIISPRE